MGPDITYHEAQRALQQISRRLFEKEMRPDGDVRHFAIMDPRHVLRDLPNVGVRMFVNGTWEYEDGTPAGGADDGDG